MRKNTPPTINIIYDHTFFIVPVVIAWKDQDLQILYQDFDAERPVCWGQSIDSYSVAMEMYSTLINCCIVLA